ncbi:MAG: hypothetical protein VST68_08455 [Nitrospirota bacterium]|nr:hypothetical protein [Nitrospirota bacterium]
MLLLSLPVCMGYAADGNRTTRLIVEDVMIHPGKPAMLEARLVQDGPSGEKGLAGETIRFQVQGQKARGTVTGEDGRATLEYTTPMRGNQVIKGIVEPSANVQQVEGIGNFASWERRRPLLFVDLETVFNPHDTLQALGSSASFVQTMDALGDPEEHAPSELTKLGLYYYNIIYLYRGEAGHRDAIRVWLQDHHFPPGITKVVEPGAGPLLEFITSIKAQGWDTIEAGIGLTKEFAEVLVKNRISTVILRPAPSDEKFPRRTKFVTTWKKIRRYL